VKKNKKNSENGAETIHWDLSDLYPGMDSKELKKDKKRVIELSNKFNDSYRGKISEMSHKEFAVAISEYEEIIQIMGRIG